MRVYLPRVSGDEGAMKVSTKLPMLLVLGFLAAGVVIVMSPLIAPSRDAAPVAVAVPALSALAQQGEIAFDANCVKCHGPKGSGSEDGPPLVHNIYNAGHHADAAFLLAARNGVRQHHWPFGDMPPLPQVGDDDIRTIVQYVRELQAANGIVSRPHGM
jgi:mono/diheme cytochrome c family protein